MTQQVVSLSGGKDSTAMLLMMLERGEPIHSVVWFDTGWEFPEMYEHIEKLREVIDIVTLYPPTPFNELLRRNGWPASGRRWCTGRKMDKIRSYSKRHNAVECIGYAMDEKHRTKVPGLAQRDVRFPLIEYGITEEQALEYCKRRGFDWGGLYNHFSRVSCFCCPLKGSPTEWRTIRREYPELWQRMLRMDDFSRNRGFYGYKTVHDLERRFAAEDWQLKLPFKRSS